MVISTLLFQDYVRVGEVGFLTGSSYLNWAVTQFGLHRPFFASTARRCTGLEFRCAPYPPVSIGIRGYNLMNNNYMERDVLSLALALVLSFIPSSLREQLKKLLPNYVWVTLPGDVA